jgi:glucose-6-phosphate isomerase
MKDLKNITGLDIQLNNFKLIYDNEVYPVEAKPREYTEAIPVYQKKDDHKQMLYWMYRYFEAVKDKETFEKADLEYDLTVIKNGKIGEEYVKTVGHYHARVPRQNISYPEVYEVIEGQIEYLLQSMPDKDGKVDVILVQTEPGDKVVVPPGYGHISINIGNEVALSSNLQKRDLPASANYDFFNQHEGGAFYRTEKGLEPNSKYIINSLRIVKATEQPNMGLVKSKSLYDSFLQEPSKFGFLLKPQNYNFIDLFVDVKL